MNVLNIRMEQQNTCNKFGANFVGYEPSSIVGVALNVKSEIQPINGFRHIVENGTNGWYIYAGEQLSTDPDFFKPIHVNHLNDWCPKAVKYLGLPPGWRFLITSSGYEDVWFDPSLLSTNNRPQDA